MISDDSYIQLERRDLHNISHIKLIYARLDIANVCGCFGIFLLKNWDDWIEVVKFNINENLTEPYIWAVHDVDVNIENYAIRKRGIKQRRYGHIQNNNNLKNVNE